MDNADFLLEAAKNSIEAGASRISLELDYRTGTVKLTCRDDGKGPMIDNVFGLGKSERGPNRGLGLYMLRNASGGRCGLRRENGETVLEAFLPVDSSMLRLEDTLPAIWNLNADIAFAKRVDGEVMYGLGREDIDREGIDPTTARGMAELRNLVRLNEERSRKKNGKTDN